jgi:hypothetical protein
MPSGDPLIEAGCVGPNGGGVAMSGAGHVRDRDCGLPPPWAPVTGIGSAPTPSGWPLGEREGEACPRGDGSMPVPYHVASSETRFG